MAAKIKAVPPFADRFEEAVSRAASRQMQPQALVASELGQLYGEAIRWDRDSLEWRRWAKTHWAGRDEGSQERVFGMIRAYAVALAARTTALKPAERKSVLGLRYMRDLEGFLIRDPNLAVPARFWDADPFLLGTPDGTVDLRTGKIRPADPGDYISKLTGVRLAPKGAKAPLWSKFLDQITDGGKDVQRFLQQWAGASAIGNSRDQRFVFIYGPGGNGKGVYTRCLGRVLGPYHTKADPELFIAKRSPVHSQGKAKIMQARFVTGSEIPPNSTWDMSFLKDVSGGDNITARFLYQNDVDFPPRCSITIAGNDRPALTGVDHAIRRRFVLIDFPVIFRNPIADLDEQILAAEGPAILRWIVDGAVDRERTGSLILPASAIAASEAYFDEEDLVRRFLIERYERDERPLAAQIADPWQPVGSTELFDQFKDFMISLGRKPGSHTSFTLKVKAEGVEHTKTTSGHVFKGLRNRGYVG